MIQPSHERFRELAQSAPMVPLYSEIPSDLETPVSVYLKLAGSSESFLLESVEGGEQLARYSFICANPSQVFTAKGRRATLKENGRLQILTVDQEPLCTLRKMLAGRCVAYTPELPRFIGGAVGFLSYDMARQFERIRSAATCQDAGNGTNSPDAVFLFTDTLVAFDHVKRSALVIALAPVDGDADAAYEAAVGRIDEIVERLRQPLPAAHSRGSTSPRAPTSNMSPSDFAEKVRAAQEHIKAGDIFQVVLSQTLTCQTDVESFEIYRALRRLNPSPYMFYLNLGDTQLIGSSPETLVRLENGVAELNPIAGTRPRGATAELDRQLAAELCADPKERAEHVMLVDLGRNDLGRVCEFGSVQVKRYMEVERYSHVMHLVSQIQGDLRPGLDGFDLLRATFPAGTVSGAPKPRAMEIIDELEPERRGPYAGAVGYFGFPTLESSGNMDFCITIRTIVMHGREARIQAGAGIVADSVPELEYEECMNKARALAEAIRAAEKTGQEEHYVDRDRQL